jgi:hypothetical protein
MFFLLALAACRPSPAHLDAAIQDCRTRARAGAGDYAAAFEVCLVDHAKLDREVATNLGTGEDWRARAIEADDREERWRDYAIYTASMRLTRFKGVDSSWIEQTIRRDSTSLASFR